MKLQMDLPAYSSNQSFVEIWNMQTDIEILESREAPIILWGEP